MPRVPGALQKSWHESKEGGNEEASLPESVNSPRIIRPNSRIRIPELGLEHLSTGMIEAASILTAVLGVAAQFFLGACMMCSTFCHLTVQS